MKSYHDTMQQILDHGRDHKDRTGVGRRSIFGLQTRFDLRGGKLPVPNTRKVFLDEMVREQLWFTNGNKNDKDGKGYHRPNFWGQWTVAREHVEAFVDKHMHTLTFDSDAERDETRGYLIEQYTQQHEGSIGPMYGAMWRHAPTTQPFDIRYPRVPLDELPSDKLQIWKDEATRMNPDMDQNGPEFLERCNMLYRSEIDQLNELVRTLKNRPYSSRMVVASWVPETVPFEEISPQENVLLGKGSLAACHAFFQVFVLPPQTPDSKPELNVQVYIRSNDWPAGNPYNVAQYALLAHMLAHVSDMEATELILTVGDAHIYANQIELAHKQLSRTPLPDTTTIWLNPQIKDLFAFGMDDVEIRGYEVHPDDATDPIRYPVAK